MSNFSLQNISSDGVRIAIFEVIVLKIPISAHYPEGIKYSAWFYYMKNRKVLLVVESTSKAMDRAFSAMSKRPKANKNIEIISFPDFATLGRVITGARLELLSNIKLLKPHSIQELARMVKRDFKNVYQDIQLLAEFGLIELKSSGPRKSAEPIAKYSEIILAA